MTGKESDDEVDLNENKGRSSSVTSDLGPSSTTVVNGSAKNGSQSPPSNNNNNNSSSHHNNHHGHGASASNSGSLNGTSKRKKKTRTVFSRSQVFQLESTFDVKRYLSSSERAGLAASLHLTETQVSRNSYFCRF